MLGLTSLQRRVLKMRDEEGLTYEQIGDRLKCSKQNAYDAYRNAKNKMSRSPLEIRISECYSSYSEFAMDMGMGLHSVLYKVKKHSSFKVSEMWKVIELLNIEVKDIPIYFPKSTSLNQAD